ncbi:MAG: hypothetical protein CMO55_11645 [Verrucomicrobiales bacterium]|nr:hypothetical protein [Verrucomicrobiales bacterium]
MSYASRKSPLVRRGHFVGVSILILSAFVSGFFLFRIFLEAHRSSDWPSTGGIVERAEVIDLPFGSHRIDVRYRYRVGDEDFVGTRIRASDGEVDNREIAEDQISGLQSGEEVTVYYDPAIPESSFLRPGAGLQEYFLLFVPFAMLIWGLYKIIMPFVIS